MNRHRFPAPNLILNPYRSVEIHNPALKFEGYVEAELIHKRTGLVARSLRWRNLITDAGLNGAGTAHPRDLMTHAAVGTGSTAPAVGQTQLVSELARTSDAGGFGDETGTAADNSYRFFRRTRRFTTSQANGNLTEVGWFSAATAGTMWSRSLIKDSSGNPTTLTKTSDYELRITYELRLLIPADATYVAPVNGANQTITVRPSRLTWWYPHAQPWPTGNFYVYTGAIGTNTGGPAGTYYLYSGNTLAAYATGNFYRENLVRWDAAVANATLQSFGETGLEGGGSVPFTMAKFQHQLQTAITKVNTQKLEINFRNTWGRA